MKFFKRKYLQLYVKFLSFINANDCKISSVKYYLKNNKKLQLDNPIEFMEKIQWLKHYKYTEKYSLFVDKYDVRNFVSSTIGDEYLNKVIGVYDCVDNIDFDALPNQFVLKGTHGSGYNIIITDKKIIDIKVIKRKLNGFLSSNYYYENRELIYKNIKPRIIIENYLSDHNSNDIIDYKFYCFNGVPKYVLVKKGHLGVEKKCFYDLEWNKIFPDSVTDGFLIENILKPENFTEMIEVASKLSQNFIFIRVDLYAINSKIIFGELTFFPTGGNKRLNIERFNKEFGDFLVLPS